jgi:hypothetical protein
MEVTAIIECDDGLLDCPLSARPWVTGARSAAGPYGRMLMTVREFHRKRGTAMAVLTPTHSESFAVSGAKVGYMTPHQRRALVESNHAVAMAVACGLLFWGSTFATNMVHDQLNDQKITFPPAAALKEFPSLQQYAGQAVDNGPKAKAYANDFIAVHLQGVNDGKTYSETSGAAMAARSAATAAQTSNAPNAAALDKAAAALEGKTQTLFRGETLRGLLLYAWGWWLVGRIAFYVAVVALIGAIALFVLAAFGFVLGRREHRALAG